MEKKPLIIEGTYRVVGDGRDVIRRQKRQRRLEWPGKIFAWVQYGGSFLFGVSYHTLRIIWLRWYWRIDEDDLISALAAKMPAAPE